MNHKLQDRHTLAHVAKRSTAVSRFSYHAVPDNLKRLVGFRYEVCRAWFEQRRRRSQKDKMTWARFGRLEKKYVPCPRRVHPYPPERFAS